MTAAERLRNAGYPETVILENYSYDDALIGVTEDGRAVYDFDKMVSWLMQHEGLTAMEAIDLIEDNTLAALQDVSDQTPIIIYPL